MYYFKIWRSLVEETTKSVDFWEIGFKVESNKKWNIALLFLTMYI